MALRFGTNFAGAAAFFPSRRVGGTSQVLSSISTLPRGRLLPPKPLLMPRWGRHCEPRACLCVRSTEGVATGNLSCTSHPTSPNGALRLAFAPRARVLRPLHHCLPLLPCEHLPLPACSLGLRNTPHLQRQSLSRPYHCLHSSPMHPLAPTRRRSAPFVHLIELFALELSGPFALGPHSGPFTLGPHSGPFVLGPHSGPHTMRELYTTSTRLTLFCTCRGRRLITYALDTHGLDLTSQLLFTRVYRLGRH
jgi:hypothetical protein